MDMDEKEKKMTSLYDTLQMQALKLCHQIDTPNEIVKVKARTLSTEEAIGNPEADDFPLQKGKERLMQAQFGRGLGQAFTDQCALHRMTPKRLQSLNIPCIVKGMKHGSR